MATNSIKSIFQRLRQWCWMSFTIHAHVENFPKSNKFRKRIEKQIRQIEMFKCSEKNHL